MASADVRSKVVIADSLNIALIVCWSCVLSLFCYAVSTLLGASIVLQQTHHIVTHTGPHKVTSSNIYQIKAQSLGSSKLQDATVRTEGEFFYGPSTEGTRNTLV